MSFFRVRDAEQWNADSHDNANDAEYAEQPRKLLFGNAYRGNGHAVHDAALAGHATTYRPRGLQRIRPAISESTRVFNSTNPDFRRIIMLDVGK